MVVSKIFYFQPYLGKSSNWTNMFQLGWNHQLDIQLIFMGYLGCCGPSFFDKKSPGVFHDKNSRHPEAGRKLWFDHHRRTFGACMATRRYTHHAGRNTIVFFLWGGWRLNRMNESWDFMERSWKIWNWRSLGGDGMMYDVFVWYV